MSHETFELIDKIRRSGQRAAMATLVRTHGTTPRKEGTKMFVGADGSVFGSVTIGGCVDARVIEHARDVLASATPHLLNLQLGDEDAWEIGLTCGGKVDVFIEPLDGVANLYEIAKGRSIGIATDVRSGAHALIEPPDGRSRMINDTIYVEVLRPLSTMYIFGAGAVAIPLITFAKAVGFRTVVVDGRPQFASRERFPEADEIRIGIASELAEKIHFDSTTPVVLVAHDYKYDIPILKRVLTSDAPYVGLLGSRRRGAAIQQMLRDEGVTDEQLRRVRVPIGLDIGGETAAEIALSIVAEVVAVTHGRNGNPLHVR
ncbi:MAG: XdhC family protein [Acidobacteriota bacterium]|nr:XdhC family protein [Acidobacteriota bacterium]